MTMRMDSRRVREVACGQTDHRDALGLSRALCAGFDGVRQGLYVFVFANEGADVLDNPKNAVRRKIVVRRQGVSIKPGKFEKGLAVRLASYNEHLHRTGAGGQPEFVLGECFKHAYLLDLTRAVSAVGAPAPIFERYWIEAVNRYLTASGMLSRSSRQKKRSEWRHIETNRWTSSRQNKFRDHLEVIAQRIFEMARVGAFPAISRSG